MKANKIIAIMAMLTLFVPLAACSSGETASGNSVSSSTAPISSAAQSSATSKASQSKQEKKNGPTSGTVGNYTVSIESVKTGKDYEGKKAVAVKIKWTNNSKEATSAMGALMITTYQDGIQLDNTTLDGDSLADNESKNIQPGKSLEFDSAFILTGKENKVQVDVADIASLGSNKVSATFDIK